MNTSPHVHGDIKFSIVSDDISNNCVFFPLHCVNIGAPENTLKTYKTKNYWKSNESNLKTSFSIQHKKHNLFISLPLKIAPWKWKKIFCRKHMHMCHLKCLLWWMPNFHLYESINEIFHKLKNLVKNKNCIIAKRGKIITKCGSCLWLQSRAV